MAKASKEMIIKLLIANAQKEVGTKEDPPFSNITKYNIWYYGKKLKAPWCAVFLSWLITKTTGFPWRIENVPFWMDYHKKYKTFITKNGKIKPEKGDLVFLAFSEKNIKLGIPEHIGLLIDTNNSTSVQTIEGNTSKTGSQDNGGEVCIKTRFDKNIIGYGRHDLVYMYEKFKGKEQNK